MRVKPKSSRAIFHAYAAGQSPRAIARKLNKKGIPGPWVDHGAIPQSVATLPAAPGSSTTSSTSGASYGTASLILRIPQVAGVDPGLNSPDQWTIQEVPGLRIVDDTLWEAVKTRRSHSGQRSGGQCACQTLLGGQTFSLPAQRARVLSGVWQPLRLDRPRLPRLLCCPAAAAPVPIVRAFVGLPWRD